MGTCARIDREGTIALAPIAGIGDYSDHLAEMPTHPTTRAAIWALPRPDIFRRPRRSNPKQLTAHRYDAEATATAPLFTTDVTVIWNLRMRPTA